MGDGGSGGGLELTAMIETGTCSALGCCWRRADKVLIVDDDVGRSNGRERQTEPDDEIADARRQIHRLDLRSVRLISVKYLT